MRRITLVALRCVLGIVAIGCVGTASADTVAEAISKAKGVLDDSLLFIEAIQTKIQMADITSDTGLAEIRLELQVEHQKMLVIRADLLLQEAAQAVIGLPMLADSSPAATLGNGETAQLTFQFIDPSTGLFTPGPSIGSVRYSLAIPFSEPIAFIGLGTSFEAASNFSLGFTMTGFEQLIVAQPFDLSGNPIILPGIGGVGDNVAEGFVVAFTPEPSGLFGWGTGFLGLLGLALCRRMRRWKNLN